MIRVKEKAPTGRALQINTSSVDNLQELVRLLGIENNTNLAYLADRESITVYIPALQQNATLFNGDYLIVEDNTNLVWTVKAAKFPEFYEII